MDPLDPPPPPPSLFGKLPVELLKHIVALVKEQDEAFNTSNSVVKPGRPVWDDDGVYEENEEVCPSFGQWSDWYGEGLLALSLCNKQFRALVSPELFRSTNAVKLSDPPFKLGLFSEVCAHVCHLDLARTATEEQLLDCAAALPRLSNLSEITVSCSLAEGSVGALLVKSEATLAAEWREADFYPHRRSAQSSMLVRKALRDLSERVSRIVITNAAYDGLRRLLPHLGSSSNLRRLEIKGPIVIEDAASFETVLQRFSLTELSIKAPFRPFSVLRNPVESLHLPTLTSLSFDIDDADTALHFIQQVAPNVTHLSLRDCCRDSRRTCTLSVDLLKLSHLDLSGAVFSSPTLLTQFPTSPIRHLLVRFTAHLPPVLLHELFPRTLLSPLKQLRHLRVELPTLHPPCDLDDFRNDLSSNGVFLDFVWIPTSNLTIGGEPAETMAAALALGAQQAAAVLDTLDWAVRRLVLLTKRRDHAGVEELADALHWVRQRQVIEEQ